MGRSDYPVSSSWCIRMASATSPACLWTMWLYRSGAMRSHAYADAQGYTDTEVAPDAASSSISYSVRTVRFGELASEPREFRHRRRVSGSDALKVAFAGDQEVLRCRS